MTRWLAVALLLSACAPFVRGARVPTSPEAATLDAVAAGWRAAGLPWRDDCDAERERLLVAVVDDAEMRRAAGWCAAGAPVCGGTWDDRAAAGCLLGACAAGSATWEQSEPWPVGLVAPWRVTLLASGYMPADTQLAALAHEYAHALEHCNGGNGRSHSDARIWGADGVVERATP